MNQFKVRVWLIVCVLVVFITVVSVLRYAQTGSMNVLRDAISSFIVFIVMVMLNCNGRFIRGKSARQKAESTKSVKELTTGIIEVWQGYHMMDFLLLKKEKEEKFQFVNLTKGIVYPEEFESVESAIAELDRYRDKGCIYSWNWKFTEGYYKTWH